MTIVKMKTTRYTWGIGKKRILAQGCKTEGTVLRIEPCYWLKINTKPVRANTWDGARFPHMVLFEYAIDGKIFNGKRYWPWQLTPPSKKQKITVYYDPSIPGHWAIQPK